MKYVNFLTSLFTGAVTLYILFLVFSKQIALSNNEKNRFVSTKKYSFYFILLLFVQLAIRIYKFGYYPVWYNFDEAMSSYDAYSLMLYGTDHWGNSFPVHMPAWGYTHQSALFTYLLVPFIKFFGYNPIAVRIPTLILSTVGAVCLTLTVRDILGDKMSLIALLICSLNPWHFVQSRYGIDCNLFAHVFITGLFFIVHFIKTNKKKYLYIGTIVMALTLYAYIIAAYSVPIFMLMVFIYLLLQKRIDMKTLLINVLIFVLLVTPIIILILANLIGATENIQIGLLTIPSLSGSDRKQDVLFLSDNIFVQLFQNLLALIKNMFFQVDSWPWDTIEHYGTMYHCMASLMFCGIILIFVFYKRKLQREYIWVLISYLVMTVLIGLITKDVTVIRRLNVFYYLGMILICYSIMALSDRKKLYYLLVFMFIPLGMLMLFSYHHSYLDDLSNSSSITGSFPRALNKAKEIAPQKYYITNNVVGADTDSIAEIYTLVEHKIDPKYFMGYSTDEGDALSYTEKYNYVNIRDLSVDESENAVYVVTYDEAKDFNNDTFDEYAFGLFSVMVPKSIEQGN